MENKGFQADNLPIEIFPGTVDVKGSVCVSQAPRGDIPGRGRMLLSLSLILLNNIQNVYQSKESMNALADGYLEKSGQQPGGDLSFNRFTRS